jgi:glycosyltransferase involved in cell wall biosynthesis
MKILIVHRYFWPDQANCGQILWHLAKHYQSEGHQIDVLTSLPSRNYYSNKIQAKKFEIVENINIVRMNLPNEVGKPFIRIYNAIKLGFKTNFIAKQNNYDVIIASTVPPVLNGFFSAIASLLTKAKFFYFCMDLYPEVGKLSGDFSNPVLYKFLEKIDNWSCKKADSIIVHSADMKNTLKKRKNWEKFKIKIINNFSVPAENNVDSNFLHKNSKKKNKLTIIFAGNVGRFQGLENIIDAMSLIKDRKDIELIIMGDGAAKEELKERAGEKKANIIFFDYQTIKTVKEAILKADIGLVTLKPNVFKYAYPGKVMTYLEQGRPFISTIESESELIKQMKSEGYGFYVNILDINKIAKLFISLADDASWKLTMNKAAKVAYEKNFSKEKIFEKWSKIL